LRASVRAFAEEREWQGFHTPKNLAMALAGEVGDMMIYLTRLCDVLDVDPVRATVDKLADSARRYPADQARGTAAKARS